jgi:CRP-like cAMP-binding protein
VPEFSVRHDTKAVRTGHSFAGEQKVSLSFEYSASGIFHKQIGFLELWGAIRLREFSHQTNSHIVQGGNPTLNNRPNSISRRTSEQQDLRRTNPGGARIENLILLRILDKEYNLIRPHLEFIEIRGYQSLHEPGETLEYAYFPNRGMICFVLEISDGRTLEVGIVTKKGFVGESLTGRQSTSPYRMICQPPVDGFRIKAEALLQILPSAPDLRSRLSRHAKFQCLRVSQIAACNRFHEIEQRLARWLLMSQDRVGSALLPFTHEFLASMLGTGRASVSIAAGILQKAGLIQYRRGTVRVLKRKDLEEAACECYQTIRQFEAESERNVG